MPDQLSITMLPAKEGDCLMVSFGDEQGGRKHILIDAGRDWTYKNALKAYLTSNEITELELLVVTHVDRDHIEGMLALFEDDDLDLSVKEVWFNTWDHLEGEAIVVTQDDDEEEFGARMGEELSPLILGKGWLWNRSFDGFAAKLGETLEHNSIRLGGLQLTLLSPDDTKLDELKPKWKKECEKAGIKPGSGAADFEEDSGGEEDEDEAFGAPNIERLALEPFEDDHSPANGSSIAFILEYKGRKLFLSGDAHVDLLVQQLRKLGASSADPLKVDAFKVPHHGSEYNISKELLELLDCGHYLVSTSGSYFKHPSQIGMARLIKYGSAGSTIHFNYKTQFNDFWGKDSWRQKYSFSVAYPPEGEDGYRTLVLPVA